MVGWLVVALALPIAARSQRLGQRDPWLLLLIAGALLAARQHHDAVAGLLVGVAAACNLYPGLLLTYFALQRRWGVVGAGIGCFAIVNGLTLVALGWAPHRLFLIGVMPLLAQPTVMVDNIFSIRRRRPVPDLRRPSAAARAAPAWMRLLQGVNALLVVGLIGCQWRHARKHGPTQAVLASAGRMVGIVLVSPLCWSIYLCALLLAAVPIWEWAPHLGRGKRVRRGLVSLGVILFAGASLVISTPIGLPYTSTLPLLSGWGVFALTLWASGRHCKRPVAAAAAACCNRQPFRASHYPTTVSSRGDCFT